MESGVIEVGIDCFTFSSVPRWKELFDGKTKSFLGSENLFAAANSPQQYIAASCLYSCLFLQTGGLLTAIYYMKYTK